MGYGWIAQFWMFLQQHSDLTAPRKNICLWIWMHFRKHQYLEICKLLLWHTRPWTWMSLFCFVIVSLFWQDILSPVVRTESKSESTCYWNVHTPVEKGNTVDLATHPQKGRQKNKTKQNTTISANAWAESCPCLITVVLFWPWLGWLAVLDGSHSWGMCSVCQETRPTGVHAPDYIFIRHSFRSFVEFNKCLLENRRLFSNHILWMYVYMWGHVHSKRWERWERSFFEK